MKKIVRDAEQGAEVFSDLLLEGKVPPGRVHEILYEYIGSPDKISDEDIDEFSDAVCGVIGRLAGTLLSPGGVPVVVAYHEPNYNWQFKRPFRWPRPPRSMRTDQHIDMALDLIEQARRKKSVVGERYDSTPTGNAYEAAYVVAYPQGSAYVLLYKVTKSSHIFLPGPGYIDESGVVAYEVLPVIAKMTRS